MFENLDDLRKRDTVETSHGPVDIVELSYAEFEAMQNAAKAGEKARSAAIAVKAGVVSLANHSVEDIAEKFPMGLLDELLEHVMRISGAIDESGEEVDTVGNSDAEQNAA